jgi:hypothetical protein
MVSDLRNKLGDSYEAVKESLIARKTVSSSSLEIEGAMKC